MYFAVLNASISSNWLLRDYGRLYAGLNLLDLKTMAIYGTEQVVAVEYKTSANHIQYIIHFPKEESKILQYANCKYLHIDGPVLGFLSSTDLHLWTFDEAWTIECPGKPLAVLLNGLSCSLFYASDAGLFLKGATSHQHVLPALSTGLPYFGIPLFKNSFENIPIEFCIQRTVSEICLFRQGHEVWALTTASCIQIM